jgi:N-acetylmuramoyl-L-alanine amidase
MMMKYILLDNGHGNDTPGKRSPVWSDGAQLFEYEFNRAIVNGVIQELAKVNIPVIKLVPELNDVELSERVRRANMYDGLFISIHSNAGGGSGCEIFTSKGQTQSDKFEPIFKQEYEKIFKGEKYRTDFSDGDSDKEADFYVLKNTKMPALLIECFFMDTETECKKYLLNTDGRKMIIKWLGNSIVRIVNEFGILK